MSSELKPVVRAGGLRRGDEIAGHRTHVGTVGRSEVVAVQIGIGTAAATTVTEQFLDAYRVDHVVVVGIAGGVGGVHPLGGRIAPEIVLDGASGATFRPHPLGAETMTRSGSLLTGDELIRDPARLAELQRDGVVALDMETASVAAVCDARDLTWSVERAISDLDDDDAIDEELSSTAGPDGTPDLRAVARYVAKHPGKVRHLARLGRQMQVAARVAADAAISGIRQLD
jgi:adenosylhomocysteine nucleosidase